MHVGTIDRRPEDPAAYRYGIFLRPPAEVAEVALRLMHLARDLFGFHAACAYPPHVTLLGSIVLRGSEEELIRAVDAALADARPVAVYGNRLDAPIGAAIGFDYSRRQDGSRNQDWVDLYERILAATAGVRGYEPTDRNAADRRARESSEHFVPHLTVLGHDGADNPGLREEARAMLEPLATAAPERWVGAEVTLYRFWSADWTGRYWLTQEWIPLRTWTLSG